MKRPKPPRAIWTGGRRKLLRDPDFRPWVTQIGPIRIPEFEGTPFFYLVRSVCHQQLAGKAADAIHGRVVELLGEVTPERSLAVPDDALRRAGLSRNKVAAIHDLATKIVTGEVGVEDLDEQSDSEIIRRLTQVKGIGEWTAQMYLMFKLRRPDVWPIKDLGVRSGLQKVLGLGSMPKPKELKALGERYRPWRSAAAWYCYRVLDVEREG